MDPRGNPNHPVVAVVVAVAGVVAVALAQAGERVWTLGAIAAGERGVEWLDG